MWAVIEHVLLPTFARGLTYLWIPEIECARRDFGSHVLIAFAEKVIAKSGISGPTGEEPTDYTPWLRTVLMNQARDLRDAAIAAAKRTAPRRLAEPGDYPAGEVTPEPTRLQPSDERGDRALAGLAESSPLYVLGLYCWTDPSRIDRGLLEAAAKVTRGRLENHTGLVRSADETLQLLARHRAELAAGVARNRAAQVLMAWILRSDEPSFTTWASDPGRVKAARETLTKWNQRARVQLREQRAKSAGGDADEET